ncbi:MAG: serpin family protein [Ruminococcaceae bacterium]|nr:serpin family protein [Oscillospiraceae bacterium]
MKKEQIVDMIGEAPDKYVKDAKEHKGKRRISSKLKWIGGIAAVLAVLILINNMPGIPMMIFAKAVSEASEARKTDRPQHGTDEYYEWLESVKERDEMTITAIPHISDFAGNVSKELLCGVDDKNRIWSPVNAYIALAMTAELADGDARSELLELLGAESSESLRAMTSAVWESVYANDGNEISVLANSLWLDDDLEYAQDKMDILAYDYYASVYQGDLGSERTDKDITNWIRNQTGGMLSERKENMKLAPEDKLLTMVSTIYYQAKWKDEFDKSKNTESVFHASNGDVKCTFMNKSRYNMDYFWAEDYGAVQMFLKNGSSMWFILPDEDKTVDDVLEKGDYMNMLVGKFPAENSKWMKVNLSVPQFDVSSSIDVKEGLMNMGITKVFDWTGSPFSSSLNSKTSGYPVYLNSINQETRVKIDEKGVEAASYIELDFGAGAAAPPDEVIDFILDRPFVFAITKSGVPLFVGTVNKP